MRGYKKNDGLARTTARCPRTPYGCCTARRNGGIDAKAWRSTTCPRTTVKESSDARSTAFFARLGHGAFDCGFADDPHDLHRRKGRIRAICCASRSTDRDWQRLRRSLAFGRCGVLRSACHPFGQSAHPFAQCAHSRGQNSFCESRADCGNLQDRAPGRERSGKNTRRGQLFEALIRYGLEHQATDIHCIVKGQLAVVKYRIDAEMERMRGPTDGVYTREQIRGALGYAYNTLVAEKTNSHAQFTPDQFQSCMIPYRLDDKVLNLRWQSSRGFCRQGSAFTVFIRYLYGEPTLPIEKFQDLGYSDDQAELFSRTGVNRKGLVLICGITNSGKSTTLSFYVETLPGRERLNIITVEDPAEREIEAAALQISLQRTLALDAERTPFSEIQGVLVRSDPDVIMQGEIRDVASGVCAQTLLQTGHQVLATTHAMGVMEAFARLSSSEIGFSMQTLTARKFWSLLVYQALVPKLCPACCEPADQTLPNITAFIRQRFHIDTSAMRTRCMGGCGACGGRGVRGVTVVAEMMQPTRSFLMLMREGRDFEAEAAWRSASDSRFDSPHMRGKTVFEHALYKAGCGLIDPRTVETFELFDQFEIIREVA